MLFDNLDMIISHKYKYVFVRTPISASTAISRELIKNYEGQFVAINQLLSMDNSYQKSSPFIQGHASYTDFLGIATQKEKQYRVFSVIRHPMDIVVSRYERYKNNYYTTPRKLKRNKRIMSWLNLKIFNFINNNNLSFSDYFLYFYRFPYVNFANFDHENFDFIIRFENLEKDFELAMESLGIPLKDNSSLSTLQSKTLGKTLGKNKDFFSYYSESSELIERSKKIFGPYNKEWSYEYPEEWGAISISKTNQCQYEFLKIILKVYGKLIRSHLQTPRPMEFSIQSQSQQ